MILWQLFASFFQIGLFAVGGGYAAMPLIMEQVVEKRAWLGMQVFADIVTIAEMTPGPITLNAATFVGMKMAGFLGAVVASLGCAAPSLLIVGLLTWMYTRWRTVDAVSSVLSGLKPAVVAMITAAALSLLLMSVWNGQTLMWVECLLFAAGFAALYFKKLSPMAVIALSGLAGLCIWYLPAL